MKVAFKAFDDQRPGTAGLRKKVRVFQQPHYLESFVESVFRNAPELRNGCLVIGGDGRYYNDEAIRILIRMAEAHGVSEVIIGQNGYLSTPAASSLIRKTGANGGFLLTASHNPAGPDGDFGIKFNLGNGGQASEQLTEKIFETSCNLDHYEIGDEIKLDLSHVGKTTLGSMNIRIVDPVEDYAAQMESLFDFDAIRSLLSKGFKVRFDAMHAITGPYATHILGELLGVEKASLLNCEPASDFNGGHPDPNLVYAKDLAEAMIREQVADFAAASDGDGDRNMILGKGVFVSPGDSLAVLSANAHLFPGYKEGLKGVARSMPTSRAVDAVAESLGIPCYETPTGWRFFCNLLEDNRIGFCGEESFGTSSHHSREKDGLWAALAWLNLLAVKNVSVAEVMQEHWGKFGRHYYQRHDFENLQKEIADGLINALRTQLPQLTSRNIAGNPVTIADEFAYEDPVDSSVSTQQGLRIVMGDAARIIIRLSGTGTEGATLRLYLERHDQNNFDLEPEEALVELARAAYDLLQLSTIAEREAPDLVT